MQDQLGVGAETDAVRVERQVAAVQALGQGGQEQAADIVLQAAGPAVVGAEVEALVAAALHQVLALQVVGQLQRP